MRVILCGNKSVNNPVDIGLGMQEVEYYCVPTAHLSPGILQERMIMLSPSLNPDSPFLNGEYKPEFFKESTTFARPVD